MFSSSSFSRRNLIHVNTFLIVFFPAFILVRALSPGFVRQQHRCHEAFTSETRRRGGFHRYPPPPRYSFPCACSTRTPRSHPHRSWGWGGLMMTIGGGDLSK
ncbi:hypothetical protein CEXT_672111 [Caerostris extrusa]|uniref:Secreted protein n=1 Tax=Caerostris extrusa TaxID=172846 RepID=A0AAV4RPS6_CAEEX|nr:hypothetical protein CEXT_672111 [Caerostris extrusa]